MTTDHGDELRTDRSQRHWRLVSVQAGGGLTVVRQRTRRSMQQLHLAGFLAKHSYTVAGIGDTRLGDDITSFTAAVKHAALAEHESCGGEQRQRRWLARSADHGELVLVRVKRGPKRGVARRGGTGFVRRSAAAGTRPRC